jgi:peptide/nickel transport system substrate-binding protein
LRHHFISWRIILAGIALVVACSSGERSSASRAGATGGTVVISVGGDPDILFPPLLATLQAREVRDLVFDHLADIGDSLNTVGDQGFTPRLAKSWEWSADSLSIAFHIDPRARWHDGHPVRASDVAFTYRLYVDSATASPYASLFIGVDSVSVRDSLTAVFWYSQRTPLQFFQATYPIVVLPEHLVGATRGTALRMTSLARSPVGSGRYRFVAWRPGSSIEVVADTSNYHGRPLIDRVIWSIAPDFNTGLARLLGRESDVLEGVTATNLSDISKSSDLRALIFPGLDYNFVQFNLRDPANANRPHPLFADRSLRRALTMAVDRARTVQSVYDTLAFTALGPTVRAFPTTDTALVQIPYSPDRARRMLDSLGWRDSNGDGIRDRAGRPLRFTFTVPGSSKNRMNAAVLIQDQLRQVGVGADIEPLEFAAFTDREKSGKFDAVFGGWHVEATPVGLRQTWSSAGLRARGGSNYGSYQNPVFDAQVDTAFAAMSLDARRAAFRRAYQTIIDDAPAIWIAEPKTVLAIHRRIRTSGVRPDAWWANLGEWSIPEAERIARDRAATVR